MASLSSARAGASSHHRSLQIRPLRRIRSSQSRSGRSSTAAAAPLLYLLLLPLFFRYEQQQLARPFAR